MQRYKLHLVVRDETGVTTCVVLHRLVERMIDSSALKLFNKYDSSSDEFPKEITNLCGKRFIFRLQLSDYNLKRGSDVFSVYNVFEPVDSLEEKYKSTVSVKIDDSMVDDARDNIGDQASKDTEKKRKRIVMDDENEDE